VSGTTGGAATADPFADRLAAELPTLVRLAARLLRDTDLAQDCAQETVVGAWRRRDQLRDPASLGPWLRRSLVNRIIDRSRSRRDELDIDDVEADWKDDTYSVLPELVLERAELRDELEDALARLPVIYRVPVVLHDALDWTAPEIASAMGVGLAATKQRLRRGRMMLVTALGEDDARRRASLAQPMRCWRARRHVSAYMDGELDAPTRTAVEEHLAGCPTCPPLYASLVGVRATMGGLRDPDSVVEAAMAERIREALVAEGAGPSGRARDPEQATDLERAADRDGAADPERAAGQDRAADRDRGTADDREERRRAWDRRHEAREPIESVDPDPLLVREVSGLRPGRALDLACGDGRNAVWLARRGWRVEAVDFSSVALERARVRAESAGVSVEWARHDLLGWTPPSHAYDLVTLIYLHVGPDERRNVLRGAAAAVAPGGRLLVVGHHRRNLDEGTGGPRDPRVLYEPDELAADVPGLVVERAETIVGGSDGATRVDAMMLARRPGAAG
jgi:RNA polymerase sigma-70 factor, ECF subfamily